MVSNVGFISPLLTTKKSKRKGEIVKKRKVFLALDIIFFFLLAICWLMGVIPAGFINNLCMVALGASGVSSISGLEKLYGKGVINAAISIKNIMESPTKKPKRFSMNLLMIAGEILKKSVYVWILLEKIGPIWGRKSSGIFVRGQISVHGPART